MLPTHNVIRTGCRGLGLFHSFVIADVYGFVNCLINLSVGFEFTTMEKIIHVKNNLIDCV